MNEGSKLKRAALLGILGAFGSLIFAFLFSYIIDVSHTTFFAAPIGAFIGVFLAHMLRSRPS